MKEAFKLKDYSKEKWSLETEKPNPLDSVYIKQGPGFVAEVFGKENADLIVLAPELYKELIRQLRSIDVLTEMLLGHKRKDGKEIAAVNLKALEAVELLKKAKSK